MIRLPDRVRTAARCVALMLAPLIVFAAGPADAAFETAAREAILVDFATGSVLLAKAPDQAMPPASMSKLMTVYMLFERLRDGTITLDDELPVSEKAWRMGGSKMFVEVGTSVRVEDLLRGIVVQSGNDACVVVAEGLAGSEEAFGRAMTERAREIGLTHSSFTNATGWPDPAHFMTVRDLATLTRRLIADFPEYFHYFAEKTFTYNEISQGNRNPLLYRDIGVDGMKTGHTEEAGYGLTATAEANGRRLILVVTGLGSVQERADESERLLAWGFRETSNYTLFKAGETIDTAEVWLGAAPEVPLVLGRDLVVTLSGEARKGLAATVVLDSPVAAPVEAGALIGSLRITAPDMETIEVPLQAGASVARDGLFGRVLTVVTHFVFSAIGG